MNVVTQKQILMRSHKSAHCCGVIKVEVVINFVDQVQFTELFL
jgi:hypothetical protein